MAPKKATKEPAPPLAATKTAVSAQAVQGHQCDVAGLTFDVNGVTASPGRQRREGF